jgi:hypothetical protein
MFACTKPLPLTSDCSHPDSPIAQEARKSWQQRFEENDLGLLPLERKLMGCLNSNDTSEAVST